MPSVETEARRAPHLAARIEAERHRTHRPSCRRASARSFEANDDLVETCRADFWWALLRLDVLVSISPDPRHLDVVGTVDCGSARKRLMSLTLRALDVQGVSDAHPPDEASPEDLELSSGFTVRKFGSLSKGSAAARCRPKGAPLYQRSDTIKPGKLNQRNGVARQRESRRMRARGRDPASVRGFKLARLVQFV